MMSDAEFKYDVAFSFLAKDELLATQLNDRLQDRVRTFLYSKRQEDIAGTDGESKFNAVFGQEARTVVLFYREGWGLTPFTRIEETAIKNRGYDCGYEFLLCIPLDDPPAAPPWYPKTRLWLGLQRWGIEGAASVVEARIQERGGQPRQKTAPERAKRLNRALEFAAKRGRFLHSEEGVKAANEEFELLRTELERLLSEINKLGCFSFELVTDQHLIAVVGLGIGLGIEWRYHCGNSLDYAKLVTGLWSGFPPLQFPGRIQLKQPQQIWKTEFDFDLLPVNERRWVTVGPQTRAYATRELADFLLKNLMEQCDPAQKRKS